MTPKYYKVMILKVLLSETPDNCIRKHTSPSGRTEDKQNTLWDSLLNSDFRNGC